MWLLETAFAATPWALPGLLVVAVLAGVLAVPVARRLGCGAVLGWLLVFGVGAPLVITLTPATVVLETGVGAGGDRFCSLRPSTALLATHTDRLNVAMLVPLGVAATALPRRRQVAIALAVAAALPPLVEAVQYAAHPWLGRSCQAGDVVHNWLGLALGAAVTGAVRSLRGRRRPVRRRRG